MCQNVGTGPAKRGVVLIANAITDPLITGKTPCRHVSAQPSKQRLQWPLCETHALPSARSAAQLMTSPSCHCKESGHGRLPSCHSLPRAPSAPQLNYMTNLWLMISNWSAPSRTEYKQIPRNKGCGSIEAHRPLSNAALTGQTASSALWWGAIIIPHAMKSSTFCRFFCCEMDRGVSPHASSVSAERDPARSSSRAHSS